MFYRTRELISKASSKNKSTENKLQMNQKTFKWCLLAIMICAVCGQKIQRSTETGTTQIEGVECSLPKKVGNCTQQITRYFYNSNTGKCQSFVYTGCNGNLNNFGYEDECNFRCVCSRPKDTGTGSTNKLRFFYNADKKKCQSFYYRGSNGNANRFKSLALCEGLCEPLRAKCVIRPTFGKTCNTKAPSNNFYFDQNSRTCRPFKFLGCEGNKNRFSTENECLDTCTDQVLDPKPDLCFQQPVKGPCGSNIIRYYYDSVRDNCLPFIYSGCGGNENNFKTSKSCKNTCDNSRSSRNQRNETPTKPKPVTTTTTTQRPIPLICHYEPSFGECGFRLRRYYFDKTTRTCKEFYWSGCGGNMNRFTSPEMCMLTCTIL